MEWLDTVLGIFASGATGGVFGVITTLIGSAWKSYQEKLAWERRQEEKKEDRAYALKCRRLDAERADQETENKIDIASAQGAWRGLNTSINADASITNVHKWVNDVRALFRPALTVLLISVVGWFFQVLMSAVVDASSDSQILQIFSAAELKELIKYIVHSTVFTANTAAIWWFGDRALTPSGAKAR